MKKPSKFVQLLLGLMILPPSAVACNDAKGERSGEPAGSLQTTVSVQSGDVTVGFAMGQARETVAIKAFEIAKHPVTVAEYRACVSARGCGEPKVTTCSEGGNLLDRNTYADETASSVPITCVSAEQAESFCSWAGGRLPTVSEWLLASRGSTVTKYAWGNADATCARHPAASGMLADPLSCCSEKENCDANTLTAVGAHREGASPLGVEDVLLGRGELATSDKRAAGARCGDGMCVVEGRKGEIVAVSTWNEHAASGVTFRCVANRGGGIR